MKRKHQIRNLNYWSRKFHIHLGLFLLLFIWLFSISGLLLNHAHNWKFADFWDKRKEKTTIIPVYINSNSDSAAAIKNIMRQLKISGEVTRVWFTNDSLDFRVTVPGHERNLHVDLKNGICIQKELFFNGWGKIKILHSFNGVNKNDPDKPPNWIITAIWKSSMDVIAIALIILCISSWIMWFKLKKRYRWGPVIFATGFTIVIYFVFFVRML